MPLPIVLGAIAIGSAALGLKKGHDAYSDTAEAKDTHAKAEHIYKSGLGRITKSRERAQQALKSLGTLKLKTWAEDLGEFVELFSQLKNVQLEGSTAMGELAEFVHEAKLAQMRQVAFHAREVVAGGVASLGAGGLAGVAAYGGATMFASASTGTAISALSGAAATNATLAWFGGGSLATGGLGMAGGTLVLGGLVAGPVLLVGGIALSAKAEKNLAEARKHRAKAKAAASEMYTAAHLVDGIRKVAEDVEAVLTQLRTRFRAALDEFKSIQQRRGLDWRDYSHDERLAVQLALHWAQIVKALLEAPILTEDGALNEAHVKPLHDARGMVD